MTGSDIAIVGGGPAGLTLAALLEKHGFNYVVYERTSKDTPPRGGSLDLHTDSGQLALQSAGCFDEFAKISRDGQAMIHKMWDHEGNEVFSFGHDRDAPEIERGQLRQVLESAISPQNIVWSKGVVGVERNNEDRIVLKFSDGSTETGFKLVVGADGTWSSVRQLVHSASPKYAGVSTIVAFIEPSNAFYERVQSIAGHGPMIVMGKGKMTWIQRQGDGHYRIDFNIRAREDIFAFDTTSSTAVHEFLLREDNFGTYWPFFQDLIEASTGPFHTWSLYYMPPDSLNWDAVSDVTLIGDAAHVTTPFIGEGVNLAMRSSLVLSQKLVEHGITRQAVEEYEQAMFPHAKQVIAASNRNGELMLADDSPRSLLESRSSTSQQKEFKTSFDEVVTKS